MRNKENKVKCKMGIGKELFIFLLAILAGAIVRLAYRCISCLREVVHHAHWVIELEDLIYWIGTAIFLFVQIYYTSSGSVRWYFILGVGIGGAVSAGSGVASVLESAGSLCQFFLRLRGKFVGKLYGGIADFLPKHLKNPGKKDRIKIINR